MHLVISTGMTIEQVRSEFDIPRIEALNKYHAKYPPLHIMVAAYLGIGGKEEEIQEVTPEILSQFGF